MRHEVIIAGGDGFPPVPALIGREVKAAACGAAGPASASASGLGRPRPTHAGPHMQWRRSRGFIVTRARCREAVFLAPDYPTRGRRLKGALRAIAGAIRLRRPLTRRPLPRAWRLRENGQEWQSVQDQSTKSCIGWYD